MKAGALRTVVGFAMGGIAGGILTWLLMIAAEDRRKKEVSVGRETFSKPSADRRLIASVFTPDIQGLGATISQPLQVWIRDNSVQNSMRLVLSATRAPFLALRWKDNSTLEVCFEKANIDEFTNSYFSTDRDTKKNVDVTVEIILKRVRDRVDCETN
jgi:hypothetical protein